MNNKTKSLTFGALMIALVFVTTYIIRIPVPFTQGYIHGGDSMIFVTAILFGWRHGALAGGLGSALADLLGGYPSWVLPTLIIKSIMGGLIGYIAFNLKENTKSKLLVSSGFAFIWFGFSSLLQNKVLAAINTNGEALLGEVEGVSSMEQLLNLGSKVQTQLLASSIIIPLLIIALSLFLKKHNGNLFSLSNILGMLISGSWMVLGYYVAAGLMYGSFIIPIFSIPWNIVQFSFGGILAFAIILLLEKSSLGDTLKL